MKHFAEFQAFESKDSTNEELSFEELSFEELSFLVVVPTIRLEFR